MSRTIAWFSCGIPSAVNARLAVEQYDAEIVYCDSSADEHPDSMRFMRDVEEWIGRKVTWISNNKYSSPAEVFEARSYMSGIAGAPCTVELKKVPRFEYQHIDDVHAWGYHLGEEGRAKRFQNNNPELKCVFPLIENGYTKEDCVAEIEHAGIDTPLPYRLGFEHNNCMGCVKATSPKYWNLVRKHAPEIFRSRAEQSRRVGCRLVRVNGERIFLDELEPDNQQDFIEDISCGPQCSGEQ